MKKNPTTSKFFLRSLIAVGITCPLFAIGVTPAQASAHTPIEAVFNAGTITGDVACTTGGVATGFFRITNGIVEASKNCEGAVVIPEGVTTINGEAFDADAGYSGFSRENPLGSTIPMNVTSLTIPNTVISIGNFAFRGSRISTLTIPNSVTNLGEQAFAATTQLNQITLGTGLNQISQYAFSGATSLTSLTIPSSVTSIGNHAFEYLEGLTSLTIPNSVTSIGNSAFRNAVLLTSLTIPNSVTSIGSSAFAMDGLNALQSISLGKNVVSIGAQAFAGASNITELDIPGSVTSIGNSAFQGFTRLETITIASSVLTLGSNSFLDAPSTTTLNYCGALTQDDFNTAGIGSLYTSKICSVSAPSSPGSITATLVDTQTVTVSFSAPTSNGGAPISSYLVTSSPGAITRKVNQELGGSATVTGLSSGETYTFTVIASNWGKSSLPSTASNAVTTPNLPGSPTIGTATLTNPTTASVTFSAPASNGGSTITRYTAISSPDGRTGTVNQAGSGSISVTGLTPGAAYTFSVIATNGVGDSTPSSDSNSLTTPTVPEPPTAVVATRTSSTSVNITFAAPANNGGETITSYTALSYSHTDDSLGETGTVTQPGIRSINITGLTETATYSFWVFATNAVGDSQGSQNSNAIIGSPYDPLTGNGEVACVNDGPRLGSGFFSILSNIVVWSDGCSGSAVIPNGVLEINDSAFRNDDISSVVIPSSVTTIGVQSFEGTALKTLVIPNTVTTIGARAFDDLEELTSLTIGSGIRSISPRAFRDATSLTSLVIPNTVTTIEQSAFERATSLTSLTLGNTVTTIGQSAFLSASNLTALNLPSSVRTIGSGAFEGATGLGSLVIPNGVTDIGDSAFYGASSITSLTIPDSVVNIGEEAFFNTTALLTVNYCGTTALNSSNRVFIGLANSVNITCPQTPVITVGTTDFQPLVATNVGVTLSGFDETLNYQATVKFVNVATNADVSNGILTAIRNGTSTIPGYTSYSSTKLGFKGTYAQVAAALASMTWNPATGSGNISMRIGIASMPGTSDFYFDANSGRYYKFVSTPLTWANART
ncbi:MAG: leucine-rich repeat protein, partial [Actinobacteria bacterium]|nr:leucine-rich repeat protein [Actinomycetota bacterium]